MSVALRVAGLSHKYGARQALSDVSFAVDESEVFVFLGPNGGGKTTLFRAISTLIPIQVGAIEVFGRAVEHDLIKVRPLLGIAFQSPSLDKKLTVSENLRCHGALYGMRGAALRKRESEVLSQLGVSDRASDLVETLSGGLRRRVELAKSLLHTPRLLILDEPSTGLDPGARRDLWGYLQRLRHESGITIVLTTHFLDEADSADRIAILHSGKIVALDTPESLRASVGGDSITLHTDAPLELSREISDQFGVDTSVVDGEIRLELAQGHHWIAKLIDTFPGRIRSVRVGKPTLEDVFTQRTGRPIWRSEGSN